MKLSIYHKLIVFHVFLGLSIFLVKPLALVYFICMTIFWGYKILNVSQENKVFYVMLACAYIVGVEVFLRMNNGTFFYEASKYLVIIYVLMGMLGTSISSRGLIYFTYILLLIPSIFVAVSAMGFETNIKKAIAFNLSGPVCLGIAAIYCSGKVLKFDQVKIILIGLLLPLISTTVYLFLYTPNLQAAITGTASNFATSGGFGPNQVATVLGLGMFALASRFFMSKANIVIKVIDLCLLGLISFRAIVTFSRGGVITSIVMIMFFLLVYYIKVNYTYKRKLLFSLSIFFVLAFFTWVLSSIQTSGFIDKRYANQDATGREKEDISTGRTDLIAFEIKEFIENPVLGIGVGKIKERRLAETGMLAASHNELSRILAEHGLFGILAFLILLIAPLIYRLRDRSNIFFYSFYLFWLLTINHSAMRIAAPAFIYALCLIRIDFKPKQSINKKLIQNNKLLLKQA